MLVDFFYTLRKHRVKTSLRELLDLLSVLEKQVVMCDVDGFYRISRTVLVKDETQYDKFDKAFAEYFEGVQSINLFDQSLPEDWLTKQIEKTLTPEEKAMIESMGGLDELMATLKKRLQEQEKRHQGGNKWVGTGGTSPFGAFGDNPEGVRIAQGKNRQFSAVKVWEERQFKNLDSDNELGTRNLKMALRKLRKFARSGASEKLDVNETISHTAKNGGLLDIHMAPERHNAVKLLMFFDIGGSMDPHIEEVENLFSAAKSEFKYLEYFYFHNCIYESVWKDNRRRHAETTPVWDILHRYGSDYRVIFVGDATMGPYEITYPGGSVEHWNEESGEVWMQRILQHFDRCVWLNPQHPGYWQYHASINIMRDIVEDKMFPMTLEGLSEAIKSLS
ncbi:hypothetical protein DRW07_08165 [Alteromonas sediminis]|uniref:VWA domain-containing protein n=1 Tax=Alteromonas sediminis TaxID=2259342 RepID=A0A3N5Y1H0_9ALTE|nr:hypothetical protein [Alteromonas sediminis]RPJ67482.1 hypothetical protein DRW07_08165 [Alteromonas sediminis]